MRHPETVTAQPHRKGQPGADVLDRLERADRPAKLLPRPRVPGGHAQAPARNPGGLRREQRRRQVPDAARGLSGEHLARRDRLSHPEFMAVHYLAADQVEECWQLLRQSMRSISYECLEPQPPVRARRAAAGLPGRARDPERARHDPARFYDVGYEDFVADPIGTVESAYAYFGLVLSDAARAAMRELRERSFPASGPARAGAERPAHRYALSDFGLTGPQVDERFAGYMPAGR